MDKVMESSGIIFKHGVHQDIVQMLTHIENSGKMIEDYKEWVRTGPHGVTDVKKFGREYTYGVPPIASPSSGQQREKKSFVKKPIKKCPNCGGILKIFSEPEGSKYRSRWECCKTCKTKSCGYVEYLHEDIEVVIERETGNVGN